MENQLPSEQQIDDYLLDRLSESEEQTFAVRMAAEPSWKEAVVARRLEREAMELLIAEDLRQQMKGWQAEEQASERAQTRILRIGGAITAIAASILILWLVWTPGDARLSERSEKSIAEQPTTPVQADSGSEPKVVPIPEPNIAENPKPDKPEPPEPLPPAPVDYIALANKQYKPLASDFLLRSTEPNAAPSLLDTALQAYEARNIQEAIRRFEAIGPESGEAAYEHAQEYLAHSYYQEEQYGPAAALFRKQRQDWAGIDPIKTRELEWALTLSLLAEYPSHQEEVDSLLAGILSPDSRYSASQKQAAAEIAAALK